LPLPCLIEKIYGQHSETTALLRCFRDTFLTRTAEGQEIIKCYDIWNPLLVEAIEEDGTLRDAVKKTIDAIVPLIIQSLTKDVHPSTVTSLETHENE